MENWSRTELLALAGVILALLTFLLAFLTAKATKWVITDLREQSRYAIQVWAVGFASIVIAFGAFLYFRPTTDASANTNAQPQQNSCPCPEAAKTEDPPSSVLIEPPAPKSTPVSSKMGDGVYIAADNRRYDYSPNALMGRFEGTSTVESGGMTLSMPTAVIRLAGDTRNPGDRDILSIQAAVGEYEDLVDISKSTKMRGNAAWSEPFDLKGVVCSNGDDCPIQETVKLYVPGKFSNLSKKALLIKINNRFVGSHGELFPGYVLFDKNLFSRR